MKHLGIILALVVVILATPGGLNLFTVVFFGTLIPLCIIMYFVETADERKRERAIKKAQKEKEKEKEAKLREARQARRNEPRERIYIERKRKKTR